VAAIMDHIKGLPGKPFNGGNCAPGTYYLVNNYGPGYTPTGEPEPLGPDHFTLPPQTVPTIATALSAKGISWKWYSGGRNGGNPTKEYCSICDPLTEVSAIMTSRLKNNLQGMTQFYHDVRSEKTMPAVAFVRPYESMAGHPANATTSGYEKFVKDIVNRVKADKKLWARTAIFITMDEGGGYYDSGYIQPIDFFGDGTRIPMIAVSPYARKGYVDHTYGDHASVLKFIEKNWGLKPLSKRSRDNLPNPVTGDDNPYVPLNRPAIGDLMDMFNFGHRAGERSGRGEDRRAEL
jgi:phospholipase C